MEKFLICFSINILYILIDIVVFQIKKTYYIWKEKRNTNIVIITIEDSSSEEDGSIMTDDVSISDKIILDESDKSNETDN